MIIIKLITNHLISKTHTQCLRIDPLFCRSSAFFNSKHISHYYSSNRDLGGYGLIAQHDVLLIQLWIKKYYQKTLTVKHSAMIVLV